MAEKKADAPAAGMLWGGRFTGAIDPLMHKYNASIHYDKALYKEDILGSIAFARANSKAGIISEDEFQAIERGLLQVMEEWKQGTFAIMPNDEDIHTANERRLGEVIGKDIAGKLHTGRSRNEQVVCDMRMWLRDRIREIDSQLVAFLKVIVTRAESDEIDYIMPGYTHLQRAQPVRWSQWLMSHAAAFSQDLERLRQVFERVNLSPLGCGALAGNPFRIDRNIIAEELGFSGITLNSMNTSADRDFIIDFLVWNSIFTNHVSRWAEDLIIYSTSEFGFVRLADAYSTGSSLMPNKFNGDSLELLRGKSGRAFGQMAGLMMVSPHINISATCLGFKGDQERIENLQEGWEPMLDSVQTVSDSLGIANGVIATLKVRPERMEAALDKTMLATDVAEWLVRKGCPFREAHHISGRVVAQSEKLEVSMDKLTLEQLQAIDSRFTADIAEAFEYETSVEAKTSKGGTSRSSVLEQIQVLRAMLD
ncbi:putative argininosuccinate lyase [Phialemonium atrogriseum]|uniref:argininosuccinate lyase n=1 Tax=Phialemonium atrogriseum TaxID=1093897 RepID=A0AAJ0C5M2_9PEZI|nr:putative argininosuccinate lyase [Phialemonium atrogriseum]KAK1770410.1 putative argininosuccinate lyase [Phialemonium atrogriseum]